MSLYPIHMITKRMLKDSSSKVKLKIRKMTHFDDFDDFDDFYNFLKFYIRFKTYWMKIMTFNSKSIVQFEIKQSLN